MIRMIACVVVACGSTMAVAAPVPKTVSANSVLARVTVEHVGSSLSQPALRKELALTAEQEKKLAALTEEYEKVLKKVGGPEVVNGPVEPSVEIDRYKDLAVEVSQFDQVAVKLLTDAQHRRLRQVQLQKGGPAGLFNRHVLRALAPTVEQEDAMARELAKYKRVAMVNEEMIAMMSLSLGEAPDEIAQATHIEDVNIKVLRKFINKEVEAQERVRQAMLGCLTADQRATWAALTGKPLKGEELLRVASMFGDPKVVRVVMRTHVNSGPLAQPPAQQAPLPPPPPAQAVPPPAGVVLTELPPHLVRPPGK